eukprot:gnl/Spiro4/3802_TR1877_c0_g1_i1.p1 gnl/Spiro4/3802_TR1877_c0_g1~~gnl/Spiro4/3802_TR1877_c0_g1_i1.p1  ORF type:complete len:408 (-),score=77.55 gnl/Spiro4/3802_TR1877_c0_g1_i1:181-1368(-)
MWRALVSSVRRWLSPPPPERTARSPLMLRGIRVVDLSRLFPGPYCTQLLADLGAEVIKVESPGGDYIRQIGGPACIDGNSVGFHAVNRGKKSVVLDLKVPNDRNKFLALVHSADVLVEGNRPAVMKELGLSYDVLSNVNPSLVMCSITGYGQEGENAGLAGHDLNYLAHSGILALMQSPHPLPVQIADLAGGAWPAAFQIASALYAREKTGHGRYIDISMADSVRAMLTLPLAASAVSQEPPSWAKDPLSGSLACYAVYRCKDGTQLAVGGLEHKFWLEFVSKIGRPELKASQFKPSTAIRPLLEEHLQSKTALEWEELCGPNSCVTAVRDGAALSVSRKLDVEIEIVGPDHSTQRIRLPRTPVASTCTLPGPALGAHNRQLSLEDTVPPSHSEK